MLFVPIFHETHRAEYARKSSLSTTAAPVVEVAGFFSLSIGAMDGGGMIINPFVLGAFSTTAGGVKLVIDGREYSKLAASLQVVKSLLEESEVGFGKELSSITEKLSWELQMNISETEVSYLINKANDGEVFCPTEAEIPFTEELFFDYLKWELEEPGLLNP